MSLKKDYRIAIIVGFFTGLFVIPSLQNIQIENRILFFILPLGLPLLWVFVLYSASFLEKWVTFASQFARYSIAGFLSAAIDFGFLNFLSILTGLVSGFLIGGVNVPGFLLASVSSYIWNKFWVFKSGENGYSDIFTFALVALVGIFINSSILVLITTYVSPFSGLSAVEWLNISKIIATAAMVLWNFMGFKLLVFKK